MYRKVQKTENENAQNVDVGGPYPVQYLKSQPFI